MTTNQWAEYGRKMDVLSNLKETANVTVISNGIGQFYATTGTTLSDPTGKQVSVCYKELVAQRDWKDTQLDALNVLYYAMVNDVDVSGSTEDSSRKAPSRVRSLNGGSIRLVHSSAVA